MEPNDHGLTGQQGRLVTVIDAEKGMKSVENQIKMNFNQELF